MPALLANAGWVVAFVELGAAPCCSVVVEACGACSVCMPFSQALTMMLQVVALGTKPRTSIVRKTARICSKCLFLSRVLGVVHCVMRRALLLRRRTGLRGLAWLLALLSAAGRGAACDPLLTGADQRAVGDFIGHHSLLHQCPKDLQGLLWLLAFLTGADQGTVGNCIRHHTLLYHCPQHL